jgi:hypothetical protein
MKSMLKKIMQTVEPVPNRLSRIKDSSRTNTKKQPLPDKVWKIGKKEPVPVADGYIVATENNVDYQINYDDLESREYMIDIVRAIEKAKEKMFIYGSLQIMPTGEPKPEVSLGDSKRTSTSTVKSAVLICDNMANDFCSLDMESAYVGDMFLVQGFRCVVGVQVNMEIMLFYFENPDVEISVFNHCDTSGRLEILQRLRVEENRIGMMIPWNLWVEC